MYTYNRCIRVTDNRRQTRLTIDVSVSQTTGDKLDLQYMYPCHRQQETNMTYNKCIRVTDNRKQT